jgi:hypothetical protein
MMVIGIIIYRKITHSLLFQHRRLFVKFSGWFGIIVGVLMVGQWSLVIMFLIILLLALWSLVKGWLSGEI